MFKRKKAEADPKKLWETYLKASLKQDWGKAKEALTGIIALEPQNSQTHLKMGDLLQKMGDSKEAIKAYHRSASILVKSGFGQKAVALYKIILRLDPKDKTALENTQSIADTRTAGSSFLSSAAAKAASTPPPTESTPVPEEPQVPEYSPEQEDIPPAERMPPPSDLIGEEPSSGDIPPTSGWPSGESLPELQMDSVSSSGEETLPEFQLEPMSQTDDQSLPEFPFESAPQPDDQSLPEFPFEPEATPGEESLPEFEPDMSSAASEDMLLELCIGSSEPVAADSPAEPASETPEAPAAEARAWTGTLPEIFWSLTKEELTQIFSNSIITTYSNGQTIVREGDEGDSIFAIMEGSASVHTGMAGQSVQLASLRAGDVFGEVAFLTGKPRTATVIANSDMKVMDISRSVLEKAIDKHPRILSCLAEYYHNRVRDTITKVKKARRPKVKLIIRD